MGAEHREKRRGLFVKIPVPAETMRGGLTFTRANTIDWLVTGWLLAGWYVWDGWTVWGVGGTGVGRTNVCTCRNRSAAIGAGTGMPPLALEGRRYVVSGVWHQLCWCCKEAYYLCRRSKTIQIDCTQIRTNK